MLIEFHESGSWPTREWETPTAEGWSEALLQLQLLAARVHNEGLRELAQEIQHAAGDAIWAADLNTARQHSERLEPPESPKPNRRDGSVRSRDCKSAWPAQRRRSPSLTQSRSVNTK
ncbi:hypothetical protein SAV14893_085410 [Streptomyces avermitilis]|uniref:Uncharacterized protein n=1 Tax=Streptomyces avermitilis TaxID=33903 RepID=A0A4D4MB86_STRAX|nr:hypothetical protein SAVMC3_11210 [Streptomyces avermitilis]GDY69148.1 hypothetical protein SAV14893_085410 [Streptomyces avermitilis]GDY79396.1 hypothetical protein SAV31267_088810 [Streptomyces avermitilis]GDY88363.1 hypothetical protein SAVCW2_75620 [Streptomyces avermitilis]